MPRQSRAAAVTELVGEDLSSAENAYETALWLLYAVVDPLLHDGLEIGDSDRHMVENGQSHPSRFVSDSHTDIGSNVQSHRFDKNPSGRPEEEALASATSCTNQPIR
jgi:hypothetical protein